MSEHDRERLLAAWRRWYDRATDDDDCEYLNGAGWADATSLADQTSTLLANPPAQGGDRAGIVAWLRGRAAAMARAPISADDRFVGMKTQLNHSLADTVRRLADAIERGDDLRAVDDDAERDRTEGGAG